MLRVRLMAGMIACLGLATGAAAMADDASWTPTPATSTVGWTGQASIRWLSITGGPKMDWVNRVAELNDGSIAVAGYLDRTDADPFPGSWTAAALRYTGDGRLI